MLGTQDSKSFSITNGVVFFYSCKLYDELSCTHDVLVKVVYGSAALKLSSETFVCLNLPPWRPGGPYQPSGTLGDPLRAPKQLHTPGISQFCLAYLIMTSIRKRCPKIASRNIILSQPTSSASRRPITTIWDLWRTPQSPKTTIHTPGSAANPG